MRSSVNVDGRNDTIRCIGTIFSVFSTLISTCRIGLIEGKSIKCECTGRATYVV